MARTTPLNAAHRKAGGRMVDFAGWDMPVQYDGLIQEHERVRTGVGSGFAAAVLPVSAQTEIRTDSAGS